MNLDFIAGIKDIVKIQATEEKVHYQCQSCRAGLRRPGILGKTAGRPGKIFAAQREKGPRWGLSRLSTLFSLRKTATDGKLRNWFCNKAVR